jgi:hypothetical protein
MATIQQVVATSTSPDLFVGVNEMVPYHTEQHLEMVSNSIEFAGIRNVTERWFADLVADRLQKLKLLIGDIIADSVRYRLQYLVRNP